ncbi:zinc finger matrin-type protein 3 isoform X1 [Electrophorus electricus]|uniref:zinc finger matrin-type protein 3 isoform X1 n=1 Tax=Electrophorus electricus TaxID=8005 RepID=UPI0015D0CFF6|nr:zinc finger matrin-type protein 3 isoform X1 [Electrophorus electricus]
MAMNVRNRDAAYQTADFCSTYSLQPVTYGNSSHYLPRIPGPESSPKPPVNLLCQQQPQAFQNLTLPEPLGLPPTVMSPDPLSFPLCGPLSAKPLPHHLQLVPSAPITVPLAPSPKAPEEECPMPGAEQDPALEELCKPLYCKLCNVTLNSAQQAQAHYQGKNHSKKLRNFHAGSQQLPPIRIPEEVEQSRSSPPSENVGAGSKQLPVKGPGRVILATENDYCKLCDASFSSPAVAHAHYQGKNHAKKLRLAEAQQSASSSDTADLMQRRSRKEGLESRFTKSRRTHLHPATAGPYFSSRPRLRIPRDLAMCVTPSGQFYCSMCNSGACEEADFRLHLESKQHKSKVSEQRYRSEMENLGYT